MSRAKYLWRVTAEHPDYYGGRVVRHYQNGTWARAVALAYSRGRTKGGMFDPEPIAAAVKVTVERSAPITWPEQPEGVRPPDADPPAT